MVEPHSTGPSESPATTVHVRLLDEGTDVWRPVGALELEPMVFQLLGRAPFEDRDEVWEFQPGTVVRCEEHEFSDATALAVVGEAPNRPEYEERRRQHCRSEILCNANYDWTHLAEVVFIVRESFRLDDLQREIGMVCESLHGLLADGLIEVGDLCSDGGRFRAWGLSREQTIERVRSTGWTLNGVPARLSDLGVDIWIKGPGCDLPRGR